MNGINLPLAFVGQEWLWVEVFKQYGETHTGPSPLQCLQPCTWPVRRSDRDGTGV